MLVDCVVIIQMFAVLPRVPLPEGVWRIISPCPYPSLRTQRLACPVTGGASGWSTFSLGRRNLPCSEGDCVLSLGPRVEMLGRGAVDLGDLSRDEKSQVAVVSQWIFGLFITEA